MWQRHRSAPAGALLGAVLVGVSGATLLVLWEVYVVRGSTGMPAFAAGLPVGRLDAPTARRAFYSGRLAASEPRETPAGTLAVAHHWAVVVAAAPDDPLCGGAAEEGVDLRDERGRLPLVLPLPRSFYVTAPLREVPARLLATCAAAADQPRAALRYAEEYVPENTEVVLAACALGKGADRRLMECEDGAPAPLYPRQNSDEAKQRVRTQLDRVALLAAIFSALSAGIGVFGLHRWRRRERA